MRILIYNADTVFNCSDGRHLDIAIDEIKKGNEVVVLHCDQSLGLCIANSGANPIYCKMCKYCQKNDMKYLQGLKYEELFFSDLVDEVNTDSIPVFEYNNAEELRSIEYKGIEIGIGALSSYITLTRNLNPKIDSDSKSYFDDILKSEVITTLILERLQSKYAFDLIIFQNGRGAQFKPFLNYCQREKIPFLCTEWIRFDNKYYVNHFLCDSAHSHVAWEKKFDEFWRNSKDSLEKREQIARSFFENRRYGKSAGDKLYTKDQKLGEMPNDWNNSVENIVIFNSSQDEYAAVSKASDKEALFKSHMIGLKKIVEHYLGDNTKHFTLRVHPNLKNITYHYHQDLYELNYPNLTVIPAGSKVSSYTLMEAADKIIVFGSTMGAEAAYWGKPVINLDEIIYKDFNVVYFPKTEDELWALIDNKELKALHNDKILQYGYFVMSQNHDKTKHINNDVYCSHFLGYEISCAKYQKILGSNYLYALVWKIMTKLKYKYPARYRSIYRKEA